VLDLPLISTARGPGQVEILGAADPAAEQRWARAAEAVGVDPTAVLLTLAGGVRAVTGGGAAITVRWWCADGRFYSDGSDASLGRIAAWAGGRWSMRHLAVAAAAGDQAGLAEAGVG
jgi:hypothetical protein